MIENRDSDYLNAKGSLITVALSVFFLHWLIMFGNLSGQGSYELKGKWITLPDFESRLQAPNSRLTRTYSRLNGWDGQWYYHIAENGYSCKELPQGNNPFICNFGFFPLVPALGKVLSYTGVSLIFALPLVSQILWLGTIAIFLLLCSSTQGLSIGQISILSLLVSYPGAMYFFTSYSEPTLTFLIFAIAWLSHRHLEAPSWSKILALCAVCYLVCLVKITGVIALAIPVLMAVFHLISEGKPARSASAMLLIPGIAGALGLVSFFVYSHFAFGDWALYFRYVADSWNNTQSSNTFNLNPIVIFESFVWPDYLPLKISNAILLLYLPLIMMVSWPVVRSPNKYPVLVHGLLITAFVYYFFYAVVVHTPESQHINFMRRMLPVIAMTLLVIGIIFERAVKEKFQRYFIAVFTVVAVTNVLLQHKLYQLFAIGWWVS